MRPEVIVSCCLQVEAPVALHGRELVQDSGSKTVYTLYDNLHGRPPVLRPSDDVTVPPAHVRVVTTAAELQAASAAGAQDIEIRAHLDLSGLTRFDNPELAVSPAQAAAGPHALLYAHGDMRSMRVRARTWL